MGLSHRCYMVIYIVAGLDVFGFNSVPYSWVKILMKKILPVKLPYRILMLFFNQKLVYVKDQLNVSFHFLYPFLHIVFFLVK